MGAAWLLPEAGPAWAQGAGAGAGQQPVPLDLLLRLPSGSSFEVETAGGLTRTEWRARFSKRIRERDEAKAALDESQAQLSKIASKTAGWNLGTPGTGAGSVDPDAPLSFELNQKIRRQKKELRAAEAELESLKVEANMAKVPDDWRSPVAPKPVEKTSTSEDW